MARVNARAIAPKNYEGGASVPLNAHEQLRRTVLSCLLWEDGFYEDGQTVAQRIEALCAKVDPDDVAALAIEARNMHKLRHVPLYMVRTLARRKGLPLGLISATLAEVIQRPDELTEFLAIYWRDGREPLSKQVKKGLAKAFNKFDAYQLAKYNRDNAIKLRDVLFMVHAKPKDEEQAAVWMQLVEGTLPIPDTWEVALSSGEDKKAAFERLLAEKKLGYMALLRNLRSMAESGVDKKMVEDALMAGAKRSKALPFRFIAAARAVPAWEPMIDAAMMQAMEGMAKIPGRTAILVDVSGSMADRLSSKSDLRRIDAACGLAILARGVCDDVRVFTFSSALVEVPPRHGMSLADAIIKSQPNANTYLGRAVSGLNKYAEYDRLIVITDEQSADSVGCPTGKGYMVNVAHYENGVGYGDWTRISGFSESIINYISAIESA